MINTKQFDIKSIKNPAVTVDILIFTIQDNDLKILLVKREADPFKDYWGLSGGFVRIEESLEDAARRKLLEETGVKDIYLEQLYTFGDVKRDPRSRVITVSYFALLPFQAIKISPEDKTREAKLFSLKKLPKLAFDHKKIIDYGVERLKSKIGYSNVAFGLLPKNFRLSQLQKVFETILGHQVDKRNFRKKILSIDLIKPTGKKEVDGAHRPAMLYEFKKKELITFDYLIS